MATASVNANVPVDFLTSFDVSALLEGTITIATPTRIRVTYDDGSFDEFTGTGFTFDSVTGLPTGGTLTGIRGGIGGLTAYTVTGFSMPVPTFLEYVNEGDTQAALADIFDGDDSFKGSKFDDNILGYEGDDTINGLGGNDSMEGGLGNDLYIADSLSDFVFEDADGGEDTVQSSSDYILDPNVENLVLTGGARIAIGNDIDNHITGNGNANGIDGGEGNDTIVAGGGNDLLFGWTGDDSIDGGAGNDVLLGEEGLDTLSGGTGKDLYVYNPLIDGADIVITGDKGADVVILDDSQSNNGLLEFYDWDFAREGNDLLITAYENEADSNNGFDATQALRIKNHYVGANIAFFDVNLGELNSFYTAFSDFTRVFTPGGLTGKNQGGDAELIVGTDSGDKISGKGGHTDWLYGEGGNDTIVGGGQAKDSGWLYGGSGNDSLQGGAGNDNLRGDEGDDTLDGGGENPDLDTLFLGDRADYRFSADGVNVDLTKQGAAQFISAHQGTDTLIDIENVRGSDHDDIIIGDGDRNWLAGNAGDDSLAGNGAADVLEGRDGNDTLAGGEGDDELYGGAGDDLIEGGDGFDFLEGGAGNDTLDGGSLDGQDQVTYEFNTVRVIANLGADPLIVGTDTVAGGTARDGLSDIDTLINIAGVRGSNGGDYLQGNDGYNYFEGGAGNDTMIGGGGSDGLDFFTAPQGVTVDLSKQNQSVFFANGLGFDSISGFEEAYGSFFNDSLAGDGNDNFLIGRGGNDTLVGKEGNDTIRGDFGADSLDGGGGIDLLDYQWAGVGVAVDLNKQGTTQTVGKGEGPDIFTGFEDVRGSAFADKLVGDGGANALFGLVGNDKLTGGDGSDTLDGGKGADVMTGGLGDDVYIVDDVKDKATEASKAGDDLVQSTVSFVLAANIENLELLGDGDINGTGNTSANKLTGNGGDNVLDGKAGADTMAGGEGDDSYVVDNVADQVIEEADGGIDTVTTNQATFIDNVENYIFTGKGPVAFDGGDADNKLVGTAQNDSLTGGLGNDTLDGGKGADRLSGGDENDAYVIDNVKDVIDDDGTGIETVLSSIAYTLAADFENLTLTGKAAIAGTGNAGDNLIIGNSGANSLSGGAGDDTIDGGLGADKMTGGEGSDRFLRHSAAEGKDTITDFETGVGGDVLDISDMLVGFAAGEESQFVQAVVSKTGTTIRVDVDGADNGAKFVDVVVLTGVTTDVASLVNDGNLVLSG